MGSSEQQLSEHLKRSEVACKCGCGFDQLTPGAADLFERIRAIVEMCQGEEVPILVNSGCRCHTHNAMVGGKANGPHTRGIALDLPCPPGMTLDEFHGVCLAANPNGGVGFYRRKNFIHVDDRGTKERWEE